MALIGNKNIQESKLDVLEIDTSIWLFGKIKKNILSYEYIERVMKDT